MSEEIKEPNIESSSEETTTETLIIPGLNREWRPQDADTIDYKEYTRNRIRNAFVPEGTIFKPAKPKPTIMDDTHKRVAVYARVSTKSNEQVSSIENQTRYYTQKIEKTENWSLQKIYADEGKSGTSLRGRDSFKQMIADAQDKQMDLIVCASVSRFARNISVCMDQVRDLKTMNPSHPVGVYFETENIYTLDPDSNQMLQMHALVADWESGNKSRRMILSYDQRICMGQYPVADLLGYRHTIDGKLLIEPSEAITVKYIFYAILNGMNCSQIAEVLTQKKRPTLKGRTEWNAAMVRAVLQNERRWGDLEARKIIVVDYVKGTTKKNEDDRDGAFVPNHHEGIVTRAVGQAVKYVIASGKKYGTGVMDLGVIEHGALKGFVSVCPSWGGVDCKTFLDVSSSVYNDEEFQEIQEEANIINGKEHSKVLSMSFTGYEVPRSAYFLGRSSPALTISTSKINLNRVCHERLGNCQYVEILYHPILQAIVVRECEETALNAIRWESEEGKQEFSFTSRAFCNAIYEQFMWIRDCRFKFRGFMRERGGKKILFFYLDEPQILLGTKRRKVERTGESPSGAVYINYKVDPDNKEKLETDDAILAYPESWSGCDVGASYAIRERRVKLANDVTADDLNERGKVVANPMIGELPTREEVREELNKLLLAM